MKKIFMLIILMTSIMLGQYNPYNTEGWDEPYSFTGDSLASPTWSSSYGYYGLGIMRLNSNPGGWLNWNYWKIDSLMQALVVYTDTSQLRIVNDTLQFSNSAAQRLDSNYTSDYLDLDPVGTVPYKEARVWYDSTRKSLNYFTDESDVTLNVGRELWIRIYNNTVSTILNGDAVYPTGATAGGIGTVAPAQADSDATSNVIGIATHSIEAGTYGYITRFGSVSGFPTISLQVGATIYLSSTSAGGLVTTKPQAPNNAVPIGGVIISDVSDGAIFTILDRFNPINGIAQIGFDEDAEPLGITLVDTPEMITNGTGDLYTYNSNVGHDITLSGDTIYVAETGVYEFIVNHSFQGVASAIFRFQIKENGAFVPNASSYRKTATADVGSCGFSATVSLDAGDYVTFWVTNIGNGGDCTMVGSTVSISQVR